MIKINHYEMLNIPKDADKITIKRAYFSLVKIFTPDKDPDKFRALREAYDTLLDEKKRAQYNSFFSSPIYLQNDLISARQLINNSKLKQAIETLIVIDKNHPNEVEVSKLLATAYNKNKNNGKAQKICESILKQNPNDTEVLLLLARVYADRGYSVKAADQYEKLTEMYPDNQEVWSDYIHFLLNTNHRRYMLKYKIKPIINKALAISEDMFENDYNLYIICACACVGDSFDFSFKKDADNADAIRYFNLFVKFYLADKRPTLKSYNLAVDGLERLVKLNKELQCFESFLSVLLDSGHRQSHHTKTLNKIRSLLIRDRLNADNRIKRKLSDLVELMLTECDCDDCKHNRIILEHNIVFDIAASRKQIKVLRDFYPDLFKLNENFYLNVLNKEKEASLKMLYEAKVEQLENDEITDEDDSDFLETFMNSTLQPFVRETPKVGRNDPCPCGSGKKYKKCCGATS